MAKQPIRRKHKDNPYTIERITENNYSVKFKDGTGKAVTVQISEMVYNAFDKFELEDISEMHEYERHIEHSEIYENNLNARAKYKGQLLEDYVIQQISFIELKQAIELLPDIQKRRIKKYYFDDKNEYEIAMEENTTQQAVNKSLAKARLKLKQILKKLKTRVVILDLSGETSEKVLNYLFDLFLFIREIYKFFENSIYIHQIHSYYL